MGLNYPTSGIFGDTLFSITNLPSNPFLLSRFVSFQNSLLVKNLSSFILTSLSCLCFYPGLRTNIFPEIPSLPTATPYLIQQLALTKSASLILNYGNYTQPPSIANPLPPFISAYLDISNLFISLPMTILSPYFILDMILPSFLKSLYLKILLMP